MLQGVEPITGELVTDAFRLDSVDAMLDAHGALEGAQEVRLSVERAEAPGETFEIWISIERA